MFNFRNLLRFTYRSFFTSRGTPYRLTPKRIGWLLLFYTVFPILEFLIWLGLWLDELFFPGYHDVQIEAPIFIIGNPRSGTTFLHRLMSEDTETFASMKTWEMLFAPSITARRVFEAFAAVERRIGKPLRKPFLRLQRRWQEANVVHKIALRAPEEDEYLLLHLFSALKIWTFSAILEEAERYTYFDEQMATREKRRIQRFYRRCLQRHLYAHDAADRIYLAKNPSYSPMIETLLEVFPDARFVYLARNPLQMVPSYISLTEEEWQILGDPPEPYLSRDWIVEMAQHWYTYPLARLEALPPDQAVVVNFHRMVDQAEKTVEEIYEQLGLEMGADFQELLHRRAVAARRHKSRHDYALNEVGLSRQEILTGFAAVFERFGFDRQEHDEDRAIRKEFSG